MKIKNIRTAKVSVPLEQTLAMSTAQVSAVHCVLVWVDTDEGITGESYCWTARGHKLPVLEANVESMGHVAIGRDPRDIQSVKMALRSDSATVGISGVSGYGIWAIESACWDILGKVHNLSVGRMLGRVRDRIPCYYSGGELGTDKSLDDLQTRAKALVDGGFTAMKMKIGKSIEEDVESVAAVRKSIGPDVGLIADCNWAYSVSDAIRLGRQLEPYRLTWLEDAVAADDFLGSARLAAALDRPVGCGERQFSRDEYHNMLKHGSADILLGELQRVGGLTEYVKIAHMADAYGVPVTTHCMTEHSLQVCGALTNCIYAENIGWVAALFNEQMEMVEGELLIPDRPGFGFTFATDVVERFGFAH